MTEGSSPERRLSPDEIESILARAAEAEARAEVPARHDPTVSDLMEAAAAAGLDPAQVRRAAALDSVPGGWIDTALWGSAGPREVRAFLPGVSLRSEPRPLVRAVERAAGRSGAVLESGPGRFRWREDHPGGSTCAEVTTTPAGSSLRVSADLAGHHLGTWFLALVGWAALSALTPLGSVGAPLAVLGFVLGPLLLVRPFWVRADRRARRRLERVAMGVMRALEEPGEPGGS